MLFQDNLHFNLTAIPETSEEQTIFKMLPPLLQPLFLAYLTRLQANPEILQALNYHLIPDVIPSREAGDFLRQGADTIVNAFLAEKLGGNISPVFLLLGDSGFGKSVYLTMLERSMWQACVNQNNVKTFPLFFELKWLAETPQAVDILSSYLVSLQLNGKPVYSSNQVAELQQCYQWHVFLDGYDEITGAWKDQALYELGYVFRWSKQVIISCRHEYFKETMVEKLKVNAAPLPRWWIAPFRPQQVNTYIDAHLKNGRGEKGWDKRRYEETLNRIPQLNELLISPLLCRMVVSILPLINTNDLTQLERVQIYSFFTEGWFERESKRLVLQHIKLPRARFTQFCRALGISMFFEGLANEVVYTSGLIPSKTGIMWDDFFGEGNADIRYLRQGSPLRRVGNRYSFYHKSFMEFFAASFLWFEGLQANDLSDTCTQRIVEALKNEPQHVWNQRLLVTEPAILTFLAGYLETAPSRVCLLLEARLKELVLSSKHRPELGIAASNALSMLNQAHVCFSNWDLSYTHLPFVDLSYSLCDHTNFQYTTISNGDFTQAWIKGADFSYSFLENITWGQLPLLKHEGEDTVRAVAYSPNGQWLATTNACDIYLWRADTYERIHIFRGHTEEVNVLVFSLDNNFLASGSKDKTIQVWDLTTKHSDVLSGHTRSIKAIAFSPNGKFIASGSDDTTIRFWNRNTWEASILEKHTGSVRAITFSPDGNRFASGGMDKVIYLWDLNSMNVEKFGPLDGEVMRIAFFPGGKFFALGCNKETIYLWNLMAGETKTFHGSLEFGKYKDQISALAFSPDGRSFISAVDRTVSLWDSVTGEVQNFDGHTDVICSATFSPDGNILASASADNTIRLWKRNIRKTNEARLHANIHKISFANNGKFFALEENNNTLRLWNINTKMTEFLTEHAFKNWLGRGNQVANFSFDMQWVIAEDESGTIRLWDLNTKNVTGLTTKLMRPLEPVESLLSFSTTIAVSPDGKWFAFAGRDYTVHLWNSSSGKEVKIFEEAMDRIRDIIFSLGGEWLAASARDNTIYVWNLLTEDNETFEHDHQISTFTFHPNEKWLVSGDVKGDIHLWEFINEDERIFRSTLVKHPHVRVLAFSPDAKLLASGSGDRTVRLWDPLTKECLVILGGYCDIIEEIVFDSSSTYYHLATRSGDHSIKRWQYFPVTGSQEAHWSLVWSNSPLTLQADEARIYKAEKLSKVSTLLLNQLGAIETPHFRIVPLASLIREPSLSSKPFSSLLISSQEEEFWKEMSMTATSPARLNLLKKYLLQGGTPNTVSREGILLLHWLIQQQDKENLLFLLTQNSVNVNLVSKEGHTALHIAVQVQAYDLISLLLKAGVVANHRNAYGKTAYEWAYHCYPQASSHALQTLQFVERETLAREQTVKRWNIQIEHFLYKFAQTGDEDTFTKQLEQLGEQIIQTSELQESDKKPLLEKLKTFTTQSYLSGSLLLDDEDHFDYKLSKLHDGNNSNMAAVLTIRKMTMEFFSLTEFQREALLNILKCFPVDPSPFVQLNWQINDRDEWIRKLTHPKKSFALQKEHFLFERLQQRRRVCEEAFQWFEPHVLSVPLQTLRDALKHLYQSDTTFIAMLCDGTVEQRQQLFQPRMTCLLLHEEPFYVVMEAVKKLREGTRDNKDGRHNVVSFKGTHIKPKPDAPGYEAAVSLLNQQLKLSLTSVSRLGKLCDDGKSWPVLVSKTVKGDSLKTLVEGLSNLSCQPNPVAQKRGLKRRALQSNIQRVTSISITTFDKTAFVDSVFFHLLTRPYDGKEDNYIVEDTRPIGIDNDLSFTDNVVRQKNGEHLCNIHYALFFHSQMDEPIPDEVRQRWMDSSLIVDLFEWLHNFERHEAAQHEQLLRTGLFTLEELKALSLPTRFPKDSIAQTLRDLLEIQTVLLDPAVKTPNDVVKHVNPTVYVFYQGYLQWEKQRQSSSFADRNKAMKGLHNNRVSGAYKDNPETPAILVNASFTFETILREVNDPDLQNRAKTLIGGWQNQPSLPQLMDFLRDEKRRYPSLGYSQAEMWETLNMSKFTQDIQMELLDIALQATHYPRFTLNYCNAITDKKLLAIVKRHSELTELTLIKCPKLTVAGLQTTLKEGPPSLILTLTSQDLRDGWLKFASLTTVLQIRLASGETWMVALEGQLQNVPTQLVNAIRQDENARKFAQAQNLLPTSNASQVTLGLPQGPSNNNAILQPTAPANTTRKDEFQLLRN